MSKKRPTTLLIILCFVFSFSNTYSQTTKTEKPDLTSVLRLLENRYNVSFSFADKIIKGKKSVVPPSTLTLKEALQVIEDSTNLEFKILDNRFIAVRLPKRNRNRVRYLQEVFITNFLTSGISKTTTGAITLKPKTIGILPGLIEPDILQSIQALPGILSIDETVSNINVRGGTNDQNLILWDGIKMYQSGHFFGLISAFNPYLTRSVLVSKNGTSAIYGDGVSSTIDMKLDNNLNHSLSSGIGFNLIHADGFAKLPLSNKLEVQLSARRSITDGIETPTYKQYFDRIFQDTDITNNHSNTNQTISANEAFYFYDVGTKVLYDFSEKDKFRFNFTNIYNTLNYLEEASNTNSSEALSSGITQHNMAGGVTYNRQWNDSFSTDVQVYASNYKLEALNFDVLNNQRLIQENEVLDTGIKLQSNFTLTENFSWINGYQLQEIGITNLQDVNNPIFKSRIKKVLRSHSAFSEVTYLSNDNNTKFKAGIRGNYINKFRELNIEPRLSFNHRFLKAFKVEVLGEFKSQTTSQVIDRQNDFLGVEKRRWVLANNTTIPIIKSKQASVGLHYNNNMLLISAEGYIKKVDGITTRSQGFQNQYQFVNAIGSYEIKGFDFLINKQLKNASTWLSYSFSKNNYLFNTLNNSIAFPNNTDIGHAITFAGTYAINNLKLALGINWHSGKASTHPNAVNPIFDGSVNYNRPNSTNLDSYFRTDFSSTYNFNLSENSKAKIGISIWNLLNERNILNTYHVLDETNTVSKVENKSLGLTPNLSFRVSF